MQQKKIKPIVLVFWHEHFHSITSEFKVHPSILDVSYTVHAQMGLAFAQKNWAHCDALTRSFGICSNSVNRKIEFSHVIEQARDGKNVECAESAFLWVDR